MSKNKYTQKQTLMLLFRRLHPRFPTESRHAGWWCWLLLLCGLSACEPWDLDRLDHLALATLPAESVTAYSARLGGRIEGLDVGRVSAHGFLWSISNVEPELNAAGVKRIDLGGKANDADFFWDLLPAEPATSYFYRAFAIYDGQPVYGGVQTFQTLPAQVTALTIRVAGLEAESVVVTGAVFGLTPADSLADHGFVWSTSEEFPEDNGLNPTFRLGKSFQNGCFTIVVPVTAPEEETVYIRLFARWKGQTLYGNTLTFSRRHGDWATVATAGDAFPANLEGAVGFTIGEDAYFGAGRYTSCLSGECDTYMSQSFWQLTYDSEAGTAVAMPVGDPDALPRAFGVAFALGGAGYIGLGIGPDGALLTDFWKFAPTEGWSLLTSSLSPPPRFGGVAFVLNGKAYVGLGKDESGKALRDFWVFDPASGNWSPLPNPFPGVARSGAVAFTVDEKAYVGAGVSGNAGRLGDFYSFDPAGGAGAWVPLPEFPGNARSGAVAFSAGGKGYVGMGRGIFGGLIPDFWAFEPVRNTWRRIADFPANELPRENGLALSWHNAGWVGLGNASSLLKPDRSFFLLAGDELSAHDDAQTVCE